MAREFGVRPSSFVNDGMHPIASMSIDFHAFIVGNRAIKRKAEKDKQAALVKSLSRRR